MQEFVINNARYVQHFKKPPDTMRTKNKNFPHYKNYLNAIAFTPGSSDDIFFRKYHMIKDNTDAKAKFCAFIKRKFPNVQYVNFYNKATREFTERIYLT